MEKSTGFFPGESYVPSGFTRFFWWLSTAEKSLLQDCVVDRGRYSIIGMSVMGTWLFATLAWTYFFSTVHSNAWLYVPLGIFMGAIILSIDRALIKGINRQSKNKFWALGFRMVLALGIGTFMAQPALLYLFRSEIRLQTSLDNEQKRAVKKKSIESFYESGKQQLLSDQKTIEQQLNDRYNEVSKARDNFIAETDGSGGTGKVGIRDVALAKKTAYEKLDKAYLQLADSAASRLNNIRRQTDSINKGMAMQNAAFEQYFNNGFLTQVEALNNLIKTNPALQMRYYLLVLILVLIELMPVIAKTILPGGSYEEKLKLTEELDITMARNNAEREQQLREAYNQLVQENNKKDLLDLFSTTAADKKTKMEKYSSAWKTNDSKSFSDLIDDMRRDLFVKPQ